MTGIVNHYLCQIEPEIRAFHLEKFNILKFSQKLRKIEEKNEVSLTDNFYGLAGVCHQHVFTNENL